jgi:hypothetical protein
MKVKPARTQPRLGETVIMNERKERNNRNLPSTMVQGATISTIRVGNDDDGRLGKRSGCFSPVFFILTALMY